MKAISLIFGEKQLIEKIVLDILTKWSLEYAARSACGIFLIDMILG